MIQQRTLKTTVSLSGIGVHSGLQADINLLPADPDTGIIFRRTDLTPQVTIPASTAFIGDTRLNTSLSKEGTTVSTIEHLMSAFAGLGIDNAYVDLQSAELPIMDGSSNAFVELIRQAGIQEQNAAKQFIRIKQRIEVTEGDKYVSFEPYDGFKFSLTINFDHPVIRNSQQTISLDFADTSYIQAVSKARTFGFLSEYEFLKNNQLALGAGLENTLVLDESKVVNTDGLRYDDEFVKHKLLDAVGDMYVLGHPIIGAFTGHKSGHHLNHRLRQTFLANQDAWELVTLSSSNKLPLSFQEV